MEFSVLHRPDFRNRIISPPVQNAIKRSAVAGEEMIPVIVSPVESKERPERGVQDSKEKILALLKEHKPRESQFFVFAKLPKGKIEELSHRTDLVDHIWSDERCYAHLLDSVDTVKASACWRTFGALGDGITWAILDTGINASHPHFSTNQNINATLSRDYSDENAVPGTETVGSSLQDTNGHGTHVAGIVAGIAPPGQSYKVAAAVEGHDEAQVQDLNGCPSGLAPKAKLISAKVLDDSGQGSASSAICALEYLRKVNENSREIKVDGANLSLGYPFDPKWYGCGHSPLCEEVNRAVMSGIVVVISCGNAGSGNATLDTGEVVPVSIGLSITDPANAEEAIAVGSVHKTKPHTYGTSYFSSKGPTGDGRQKPDLLAPGEKVVSCSADLQHGYQYKEDSGTSMAAPHVSGAIAAFLSVRKEFRGSPRRVKEIFKRSATDLGRDVTFQGAGLVDLFRALGSV
jgi:subtilisin family serine protease